MSFLIPSCWFLISNRLIFNISMSLFMLLSFVKIMALNSSSVNLPHCSTFISGLVEVSCSFIWVLFLCFTILAITVGFGARQIFLWLLVFCCLWLPLLGFGEPGKTQVKHHCQVLFSMLELLAQEWYYYPLAFCL
uniref:Uncharacterized protein n=1 Tax=Molossus molossus TaxID=27622 RepID=A0A7J8I035_MOLMO|nr:hypothetical protein HJG59_010875 [Molossus molossus]